MDGIHDCGGVEGYGPIVIEDDNAPKFKHDWERNAFGLHWACACTGHWNIDAIRHAMERMGVMEYLNTSYYDHWLTCNEILLVEKGVVTQAELDQRRNEIRDQLTLSSELKGSKNA